MAADRKGPRVSVVIPAYNRERTLLRAVRSVLDQSFRDLELIVVDDASTDDTRTVVEGLADTRVRCVSHDRNRGAAAARNTGIRAARGDYVAFLDSDDEWLPHKLEVQMAGLLSAPKDVCASCSGYRLVFGGRVVDKIPRLTDPWQKGLLLGCDLSPGSTQVVSRSVFHEVGLLDEELPRYEDWDWLLRYARRYRMQVADEVLAVVHRGGYPAAETIERSALYLVASHDKAFAAFGLWHRRKALGLRWLEVAQHFFRDGAYGRGLRYLVRALLQNPMQRPGMYVVLVDALFGTSLSVWAMQVRARWVGERRRRHAGGEGV